MVSLLAPSLTRNSFQFSMHTQRKQYCFWLVNVIITTTFVVIKTQLLLQMLNGDDLNFFSKWLIRQSWKIKDFINRCCINFVLPIMQLKHVFDPSLVERNERRSRHPIKVHQLLSSTLSHIKPSFQQIFYNFKPLAQIKINFYLSVLNFCWAVYIFSAILNHSDITNSIDIPAIYKMICAIEKIFAEKQTDQFSLAASLIDIIYETGVGLLSFKIYSKLTLGIKMKVH